MTSSIDLTQSPYRVVNVPMTIPWEAASTDKDVVAEEQETMISMEVRLLALKSQMLNTSSDGLLGK